MSGEDEGEGTVTRLPFSRVLPPKEKLPYLGLGELARRLGVTSDHLNGKFCSRCQGIWYGLMLECECPICGNRHG